MSRTCQWCNCSSNLLLELCSADLPQGRPQGFCSTGVLEKVLASFKRLGALFRNICCCMKLPNYPPDPAVATSTLGGDNKWPDQQCHGSWVSQTTWCHSTGHLNPSNLASHSTIEISIPGALHPSPAATTVQMPAAAPGVIETAATRPEVAEAATLQLPTTAEAVWLPKSAPAMGQFVTDQLPYVSDGPAPAATAGSGAQMQTKHACSGATSAVPPAVGGSATTHGPHMMNVISYGQSR
jgi:hypothetical protein